MEQGIDEVLWLNGDWTGGGGMERFEVSDSPVRGLGGPTAHAFEPFKKNTAVDNFLVTGVVRIVRT
jgi:hypothetical protein